MTLEQRITRADYCKHGQPMDDGCNECDTEGRQKAVPVTAETASVPAGVAPDGVANEKVADDHVESIPPVGAYMDSKHRYWKDGIGPRPSVTTVLGILDKQAVTTWKAKESARAVLTDPDRFYVPLDDPTFESGMEERIKWALEEADKARDAAAELGSSVHLLADLVGASESDPTAFQVSADTYPYVNAFRDFLGRYGRSAILSSEHIVWSANGYGGTYDLIMELPGTGGEEDKRPNDRTNSVPAPVLWLIDIKTSKGYYPEYGLQLAGYRWADEIIVKGSPATYPMPEIDKTGILHLRPDLYPDTGWRLIEYPTTYEDDYIAFLAALEIWQWRDKRRFTKSNLNKPITP